MALDADVLRELVELMKDQHVRFQRDNMSHNSADEFLGHKGDSVVNYREVHLQVNSRGIPITSEVGEFEYLTELRLAKVASEQGCKYATNLDYCGYDQEKGQLIIAASGWVPKTA